MSSIRAIDAHSESHLRILVYDRKDRDELAAAVGCGRLSAGIEYADGEGGVGCLERGQGRRVSDGQRGRREGQGRRGVARRLKGGSRMQTVPSLL